MLSIGIVGLPNVGKSTLFKALTNKQVDIQNYPFTTIDPNVGVVAVPDERVDALADFSHSKKKLYTTIEFIDIAGLVKGASQGEGLGNKFLANIRETDAIAHVVRAFDDANITHVHSRINPADDIGVINTELIIADLDTVTKRIEKTRQNFAKQNLGGQASKEMAILEKFKNTLESELMILHSIISSEEIALAKELNLLTSKKFIYVINISEEQLLAGWKPDPEIIKAMGARPNDGSRSVGQDSPYVVMCNKLELTLSEVDADEKKEYLTEFLPAGRQVNSLETGLDTLIKTGYKTLGLLTFLTTGDDESRAWTAHHGDPIPRASRAIHTDFEKLFIRADVINWQTLLDAGSYPAAREKGLIKTVGRDYIIQEGDIVEIRI